MCVSTPSIPTSTPPPPPVTDVADTAGDRAATRQLNFQRRRQALSRMRAQGAGAMQGSGADAGGVKTTLGA